ncbi:MAG: YicC/YloC family endoribonuclease [Myxococcota bacterium]
MTGYGAGEVTVDSAGTEVRLQVDARAVNHRFVEVRVRLPNFLNEHIPALEELARKRLRRGRIELSIRTDGRLERPPRLDLDLARDAFQQLRTLRDELTPEEDVPLSLLANVPGLFAPPAPPERSTLRDALLTACTGACDALDSMRRREGEALAEDLGARLEAIRAKLAQVAILCPTVVDAQRARLRERIDRLLADRKVPVDEARLEHEIAIFAERTDVAEEVARLRSHCNQFSELMQSTGPMHGRKLDFLLQEMGREVNTLGAKTPQIEITRTVVEMKADVERMREQVQNVL